jgi:hypothetical protein
MYVLTDIALVSIGMAIPTIFDKIRKRFKSNQHIDGSFPFQEDWAHIKCPACNIRWDMLTVGHPKYCECEEYFVGHFHMECGAIFDTNIFGCHFKWIMKSRRL